MNFNRLFIYLFSYPSGRLAVLRLRSSCFTTLFFDDIKSIENRFLGLVTHAGDLLLMESNCYAHFITDRQHQCIYLCDRKNGIIEKRIQYNLKTSNQTQYVSIKNNVIDSNQVGNRIQLQLNSFMQLDYHNSSNIRLTFACQNENFEYELLNHSRLKSESIDLKPPIFPVMKNSLSKTFSTKTKISNHMNSDDVSTISKNRPTQTQQLSDEQMDFYQLPMYPELLMLRKRIRYICHNWLKYYRTKLGKY